MTTSAKDARALGRLSLGTSWPLLLAAATVIALGMSSVHTLSESDELVERRWRSVQALLGVEGLLSTLADAETGQRGYIITGRATYLQPYEEAGRRLTRSLADLQTLLAERPSERGLLDGLRPLLQERLAEMATTIELRRQGRLDEVLALIGSDHGLLTTARIHEQAAALKARGLEDRERTTRDYLASVRRSFFVVVGGSALLFVLTAFATMTTARELRARGLAEIAARHRGERFRSLVDASLQVIWTADRTGAWVDAEPTWSALTGQAREQAMGAGWLDALHPADRASARQAWQAAIASRGVFTTEHRVRRPDGLWRTCAVRAVPVLDEDGGTREWVGVHQDVSDSKRTDERLRFLAEVSTLLANPLELNSALARLATLSVPAFADWCAIDLVEAEGQPVRVAVACGDPRQEELATVLRAHPPAPDEPGGIAEVLRSGVPTLVPALAEHAGARFWETIVPDPARRAAVQAVGLSSYIMVPLRARGRVTGVLTWGVAESHRSFGEVDLAFGEEVAARTGAAIDRARLLGETESARQLLDALFEAAPAGLALFDRDLRFIRSNAELAELTGLGAAAHVGRAVGELLPAVDPSFPSFEDVLRRARDEGRAVERELRGLIPSRAEERVWLTRCSPAPGAGVIALLMDITERKRAEVEREHLLAALARSNQDLNEFAYVASHDLKAPLRGITHLSEWLEEDLGPDLPEAARTKLHLLQGRARRLEALIDGILDYSRAGRSRSAAAQVDVRTLLKEVVDLLGPPAAEAVVIEERDWPALWTEKAALEQVFMNLISNALKHAPRPALRIEVGARVDAAGGGWIFTVADNGPGIAAEYHERIWGIFQTLQSRDKVEGAGIGLAIVKKIVESSGGRVWVESAIGAGARFCFTWPTRERELARSPAPGDEGRAATGPSSGASLGGAPARPSSVPA